MTQLATSQDFSERYRVALRRERVLVFAAIGPAGLYLLQSKLRGGRPLPGLTPSIDEAIFWILVVWLVVVLFGFGRNVLKRAGVACPQCGQEFRSTSFASVMNRGHCPKCSTRILSDVSSSAIASAEDIIFRYPRRRALVIAISIPAAAVLGLLMIIGFGDILFSSTLTLKRTLSGAVLILMGLAFVMLAALAG